MLSTGATVQCHKWYSGDDSREDHSLHTPEANTEPLPTTDPRHDDLVLVLKELPLPSTLHSDRLGPAPGYLQHGSEGWRFWPWDCPRCEEVPRSHVAASHGVVNQLLLHRPVHIPAVQYITVQYSTVQNSTVHIPAVQYSTVHYSTVQYSTLQYSTLQYSILQYITVRYITVQYITIQY